ncbi:hypothetical protein AVEN_113119-1 [Araneus ventricosus]|uniref:Uncharacterized protein n=1 Tax=Araneus ventricosus TaxID=182803 RepID=A0A4Y2P2I0_ARAVE|nr:hypothetical protein AVEN_113119-1 [Araneus ventricosus]
MLRLIVLPPFFGSSTCCNHVQGFSPGVRTVVAENWSGVAKVGILIGVDYFWQIVKGDNLQLGRELYAVSCGSSIWRGRICLSEQRNSKLLFFCTGFI